jgi:hypothetical protein
MKKRYIRSLVILICFLFLYSCGVGLLVLQAARIRVL